MMNFWDFYDSLDHEHRSYLRFRMRKEFSLKPSAFYQWKQRRYIPARYKPQMLQIIKEMFPLMADKIEMPTDWKTFRYSKDLHGADWKPSPASGRGKGHGEANNASPFSGKV